MTTRSHKVMFLIGDISTRTLSMINDKYQSQKNMLPIYLCARGKKSMQITQEKQL